MTPENTQQWYTLLEKPSFAPPAWVFGPVWTILYILIAISFGYVFLQVMRGQWSKSIATPFAINLIANLLFTPIQFGLRNNTLALIDVLIILITIVWMIRRVRKKAPWIAWIQLPYALWCSFAFILQASITWLNW